MNNKTQHILGRIGQQIPKELLDQLLVKKKSGQKEVVMELLRNNKLPVPIRRRLEKLLERGAFDSKQTEIDLDVQKKIDQFVDKRVKDVMRSGKVERADGRRDPFLRKMRQKMQPQ